MKIVFSRSLIAASNAATLDIVESFTGERPDSVSDVLPEFEGKNVSLTYSNVFECYSFEVNDAVVVKMLGLYVKVAKIVGPLVRAITGLLKDLKPEFNAIGEEMCEGIEPVNYREPVEEPGTEQYDAWEAALQPDARERFAR